MVSDPLMGQTQAARSLGRMKRQGEKSAPHKTRGLGGRKVATSRGISKSCYQGKSERV